MQLAHGHPVFIPRLAPLVTDQARHLQVVAHVTSGRVERQRLGKEGGVALSLGQGARVEVAGSLEVVDQGDEQVQAGGHVLLDEIGLKTMQKVGK